MNITRISPARPVAYHLGAGHTQAVVCCRRPACGREAVVSLASVPVGHRDVPLQWMGWGCPHCGSAVVAVSGPEARHAAFTPITLKDMYQAVRLHRETQP